MRHPTRAQGPWDDGDAKVLASILFADSLKLGPSQQTPRRTPEAGS